MPKPRKSPLQEAKDLGKAKIPEIQAEEKLVKALTNPGLTRNPVFNMTETLKISCQRPLSCVTWN